MSDSITHNPAQDATSPVNENEAISHLANENQAIPSLANSNQSAHRQLRRLQGQNNLRRQFELMLPLLATPGTPLWNALEDGPAFPTAPPPSPHNTPAVDNITYQYALNYYQGHYAPSLTEQEHSDYEESEWEEDTIEDPPAYKEEGSDSDDSDNECDEDGMCVICSRRKASIYFTSCGHEMCMSCTKKSWWSSIVDRHNWPTEITCPFCRGAVTEVIEDGKKPMSLIEWVHKKSVVAKKRQRNANLNWVYPRAAAVYIKEYRARWYHFDLYSVAHGSLIAYCIFMCSVYWFAGL